MKLANVTLDQCYKIFIYMIEKNDLLIKKAMIAAQAMEMGVV